MDHLLPVAVSCWVLVCTAMLLPSPSTFLFSLPHSPLSPPSSPSLPSLIPLSPLPAIVWRVRSCWQSVAAWSRRIRSWGSRSLRGGSLNWRQRLHCRRNSTWKSKELWMVRAYTGLVHRLRPAFHHFLLMHIESLEMRLHSLIPRPSHRPVFDHLSFFTLWMFKTAALQDKASILCFFMEDPSPPLSTQVDTNVIHVI